MLLGLAACLWLEAAEEPVARPDEGKWFRSPDGEEPMEMTPEERELAEQLEAMGYADGTVAGDGTSGISHFDPERASLGFNLYVSGHAPEVLLMDMGGEVLHTWTHDFFATWPDHPTPPSNGSTQNFRRALYLEDGHILAIHEGQGMVRLDPESRVVWSYLGNPHHDAVVVEDKVWVLTRQATHRPDLVDEGVILEDFVVRLDLATGEEEAKISVVQAMLDSDFRGLITERKKRKADLLHTNTIQWLTGTASHPAFGRGRLLLSFRNISALAVLDPESSQVVWAKKGPYRVQHEPVVTANGNLLVFDNRAEGRPRSRVLEVALPEGTVSTRHRGTREEPFYSATLGTVSELPNGNLLVTESERGRAFELEGDDVVWAFHSPHVAGPNGEFVAALFEVVRLPLSTEMGWRVSQSETEPNSE